MRARRWAGFAMGWSHDGWHGRGAEWRADGLTVRSGLEGEDEVVRRRDACARIEITSESDLLDWVPCDCARGTCMSLYVMRLSDEQTERIRYG